MNAKYQIRSPKGVQQNVYLLWVIDFDPKLYGTVTVMNATYHIRSTKDAQPNVYISQVTDFDPNYFIVHCYGCNKSDQVTEREHLKVLNRMSTYHE